MAGAPSVECDVGLEVIRNQCDILSALLDSVLHLFSNKNHSNLFHYTDISNMDLLYKLWSESYCLCFILPLV